MKKTSKLLIIAVAFALALTMIPGVGTFAFADVADDPATEIASIDVSVAKLLCGTKIENQEIPMPSVPEKAPGYFAQSGVRAGEGQEPDFTIPENAGYYLFGSGWLVEDPEGYKGFSLMMDPTTVKGGEKYYFYIALRVDNELQIADDTLREMFYFADDAKVNVTGAKLVFADFWGYSGPVDPDPKDYEEPEEETVEAEEEPAEEAVAAEEPVEEPAVENAVKEVTEEPERAHVKGYTMMEAVFEVTAEHVPGETVVENKLDPTETTDGHYDNVVYCDSCGLELSRETVVIPHTGNNDNNNNNNDNTVPKTGDESRLFTWIMILALAAAASLRIKAKSRD
ncbi:MAG: hypothetical protein K6D56_00850 [Clostridia bacterium]|nr:hypothetical protein [Clostridia bacterium]